MTHRIYSRIEGLEKVAAARRARETPSESLALRQLRERIDALRNDPEHQKRMAETPPEVLRQSVIELREALLERAHGNYRGSAA
jgi:hypothetical protein